MTKKNFEWFAEWLNQYPNLLDHEDAINDLKAYFKSINVKFNDKMFDDAIGNPYKILD